MSEHADELARMAARFKKQEVYASVKWELQQIAKRLVLEGKITQSECDRIIELSGGEITRIY